jgi:hypothetical protein
MVVSHAYLGTTVRLSTCQFLPLCRVLVVYSESWSVGMSRTIYGPPNIAALYRAIAVGDVHLTALFFHPHPLE